MSDAQPVFDQVNLVVGDMDAAIRFYRLLGLDIAAGPDDWPAGTGARHVSVHMRNGASLDLDNVPMARIWGDQSGGPGAPVIGFSLPSREAVDEKYAALTAAGYAGRRQPYDAFWGARYAIVEDPDGNQIGLMSPSDPDRRYTPEV